MIQVVSLFFGLVVVGFFFFLTLAVGPLGFF